MAQENQAKQPGKGEDGFSPPAITLPKGGGAIRGIGEKFGANPVTGTGSMTVPIATSPGRSGFGPQLSLSYDSGAGNGPFGLGWNLSLPSITRKTDKGLPKYQDGDESDTFILSGAEDLVPVLKKQGNDWVPEDVPDRTIGADTYRIQRYRPRIEGLFARIERWTNTRTNKIHWQSISGDNITTLYGRTTESRIEDPNAPEGSPRVFSWLICERYDDKGNAIYYKYKPEDSAEIDLTQTNERNRTDKSRSANRYLKRIKYGNKTPVEHDSDLPREFREDLSERTDWLFEVVFDYEEGQYDELPADPNAHQFVKARIDPAQDWQRRQDPFSSYRSGFEVRTYRLCHRLLMFHHFTELGIEPCLVRSTEFDYNDLKYTDELTLKEELAHPGSTRFLSCIHAITQSGYVHHTHKPIKAEDVEDQYVTYIKKSLPPLEFEYSKAAIQEELKEIDTESLENLPQGLDGSLYQWADLDGEGAGGILTDQGGAWYYKRNLSPLPIKDEHSQLHLKARFAPAECVSPLPSFSNISGGQQQILDLAGDGQVDVVTYDSPAPGFFERTEEGDWEDFKPFASLPNIPWKDPNLKFVDLTGDGHADIFITGDKAFTWYPSLAEAGFGPAQKVRKMLDEEKDPRLVFADGTDSVYLSDISGDGLSDLVRIRNGEVCYWPNLGYGRFGAKVTMDNAPWFDSPDQFDQKRIRLADIDGTGVTDILYLKHDGVRIYFNKSGNTWSDSYYLKQLPAIDNTTSVMTADLLGNGTACLVWSSPLSGDTRRPMRYVDLMGGQKPHLLIRSVNNLGAETRVHYAPSTKSYLKDKEEGKPWITRLHFPVHVVERVENYDHISHNRFVTRYAYHHGFFDGHEREFRGFGMVEQWDTEEYAALSAGGELPQGSNIDAASHVPPVHTKTWFHTGAYIKGKQISNYFAGSLNANDQGEYFREPRLSPEEANSLLLEDTILPDDLTIDEEREACRALKGQMLRQEVYAQDGTDNAQYPYTVTEQNFTVQRLQPKPTNQHAVFFTHARESLNYHYERIPADPRVSHTMTLEVNKYGNVLKSISMAYGRRKTIKVIEADGSVREIQNPELNKRDLKDQEKQTQLLITYSENDPTNAIDKPVTDPTYDPDNYRAPLPWKVRTYELTGLIPENDAPRFSFDELTRNNYEEIRTLQPVPYETPTDYAAKRKRLIECLHTLYRKNDLTGFLDPGVLKSMALPGETYKLAFTPGLLADVYGGRATDAMLADEGRYIHNDDDNWWIPSGKVFYTPDPAHTPSQELTFAKDHFFLPHRYRNPFHTNADSTESFISYDTYNFLIQETRDVLGNRVTVGERKKIDNSLVVQGNNYRVLQPEIMMDPNRNRSAVAFDTLGMVVGTAVMGKPEENLGDSLAGFEADLTDSIILDHLANPLTDPHAILQRATTRLVYDLFAYHRTKGQPEPQPAVVYSLAREIHDADLDHDAGEQTRIQHSFSYSDGFGREIQKKVQAEPGPVPERDAEGKIIVGPDNQPEMTPNDVEPRWVGSGWTVFNNKGKPVRQFEPFFTDRHTFEFDVRIGVSPYLFYDPVGRVVATLHPNHTWEKVIFDPWRQESWDVNDTVLRDPSTDDDVKGFFVDDRGNDRLPISEYQPTWYQLRQGGGLGPTEQSAANKAAAHADTSTIAHFDALGRPFLTIANNGKDQNGDDVLYETRTILDIEGNQRDVIDAKGRIVMRYDYYMAGPQENKEGSTPNRIHQASMEAGERWMLNDVVGNPIRAWDSRGHAFHTVYDQLRRPVEQYVTGEDSDLPDQRLRDKTVMFKRIEYGEGQPDDIALNLRTRVYKQYDGAGVVTSMGYNPDLNKDEAYDFKGNLLRSSRQLCVPDIEINGQLRADKIPVWSQNPVLEQEIFASSTCYDALNRPIQQIAPHDQTVSPLKLDVTQISYNKANLLEKIHIWLAQSSVPTELLTPATANHAVVENINYDAKGQRERIVYGNGAQTRYYYDKKTFRLTRLYTRRGKDYDKDCGIEPNRYMPPDEPPLDVPCGIQNISYTYDPIGNITHMHDLAQPRIYFDNQCIDASNDYKYDAIYRLTDASGREHKGNNMPTGPNNPSREHHQPFPVSCNGMQNYVEHYRYDEVGNIMEMVHNRGDTLMAPGQVVWHRRYQYTTFNNQICSTSKPGELVKPDYSDDPAEYYMDKYTHDIHGNITNMPHLSGMGWDFKDQLVLTSRQVVNENSPSDKVPETTYYVYDGSGQRVRKVTIGQNGTKKDERIYLGGYEIYRRYNGNGQDIKLQRESLHVMDDQQRVAMIETKTLDETGIVDRHNNDEVGVPMIRYQINNHLDSASTELDNNARVISHEEYYPYGSTAYQARNKTIKVASKRYRYSGKERDEENGFYYHGSRYYTPWLGRWISCDPYGLIDGPNCYVYVKCRPTIFIDMSGGQATVLNQSELVKDIMVGYEFAKLVWNRVEKEMASQQAAGWAASVANLHTAEIVHFGSGSRAGSDAGVFSAAERDRMSRGEDIINAEGEKPTNCTEFPIEAMRQYFNALGQSELGKEIERKSRDTRGPAMRGRREVQGQLESARMTALIQYLHEDAQFKTVFIGMRSSAPKTEKSYLVQRKGKYPAGKLYPVIGAETGQLIKDVSAPVDEVVARYGKLKTRVAAENFIRELEQTTFAIGTVEGGVHGFLIANGRVYNVHWEEPSSSLNLYEALPVRQFLRRYKSAVIAMP